MMTRKVYKNILEVLNTKTLTKLRKLYHVYRITPSTVESIFPSGMPVKTCNFVVSNGYYEDVMRYCRLSYEEARELVDIMYSSLKSTIAGVGTILGSYEEMYKLATNEGIPDAHKLFFLSSKSKVIYLQCVNASSLTEDLKEKAIIYCDFKSTREIADRFNRTIVRVSYDCARISTYVAQVLRAYDLFFNDDEFGAVAALMSPRAKKYVTDNCKSLREVAEASENPLLRKVGAVSRMDMRRCLNELERLRSL